MFSIVQDVSLHDRQRLAICVGRDFGAPPCQTITILSKSTKVKFTHNPPAYVYCVLLLGFVVFVNLLISQLINFNFMYQVYKLAFSELETFVANSAFSRPLIIAVPFIISPLTDVKV